MPHQGEAMASATHALTFDVREFARTAAGNHRDQLRLDAFGSRPLEPDTLRSLKYLRDLERSTMRHLRTVLVTPTHKDARLTAFLTTWAYEKYWIADALGAILEAHAPVAVPEPAVPDKTVPDQTVQDQKVPEDAAPEDAAAERAAGATARNRTAAFMQEVRERLAPIRESLVANAIGDDVVAVHVTVGTVDEWLTQTAYERVGALDPHPELARTLGIVLPLKHRHLSFFEPQARARLAGSPRARALTRSALGKSAWPVGASAQPREDTAFLLERIFGDSPALAGSLDARVDSLPGQAGLGLIERAWHESGAPPVQAHIRLARGLGRAAASARSRFARSRVIG